MSGVDPSNDYKPDQQRLKLWGKPTIDGAKTINTEHTPVTTGSTLPHANYDGVDAQTIFDNILGTVKPAGVKDAAGRWTRLSSDTEAMVNEFVRIMHPLIEQEPSPWTGEARERFKKVADKLVAYAKHLREVTRWNKNADTFADLYSVSHWLGQSMDDVLTKMDQKPYGPFKNGGRKWTIEQVDKPPLSSGYDFGGGYDFANDPVWNEWANRTQFHSTMLWGAVAAVETSFNQLESYFRMDDTMTFVTDNRDAWKRWFKDVRLKYLNDNQKRIFNALATEVSNRYADYFQYVPLVAHPSSMDVKFDGTGGPGGLGLGGGGGPGGLGIGTDLPPASLSDFAGSPLSSPSASNAMLDTALSGFPAAPSTRDLASTMPPGLTAVDPPSSLTGTPSSLSDTPTGLAGMPSPGGIGMPTLSTPGAGAGLGLGSPGALGLGSPSSLGLGSPNALGLSGPGGMGLHGAIGAPGTLGNPALRGLGPGVLGGAGAGTGAANPLAGGLRAGEVGAARALSAGALAAEAAGVRGAGMMPPPMYPPPMGGMGGAGQDQERGGFLVEDEEFWAVHTDCPPPVIGEG